MATMPMLLKDDLSLGLIAVTKDGLSLQHLSPSLRANPLIVMAALHSNGSALKHAAFALQCDPVIVSTAIARDGAALQFVQCPNLRANRDLVSQVWVDVYVCRVKGKKKTGE